MVPPVTRSLQLWLTLLRHSRQGSISVELDREFTRRFRWDKGFISSVERPAISMGRVSFALPLKALIGLHLCWSSQVCGTCMEGLSHGFACY